MTTLDIPAQQAAWPTARIGDGLSPPGTTMDRMVLAVAPGTGRFRPGVGAGAPVAAGQVLGHVVGGGDRADEILAPVGGHVRDLLVRPGRHVRRGQAVVWIDQPLR